MPRLHAVSNPFERALRLQLIHIDVWMEQGQQPGLAPVVLRAMRSIAAEALTEAAGSASNVPRPPNDRS